jgi:hypothetical protein
MKFINMNSKKHYEVQLDLNETKTTFIRFNKNIAVKKA